MQIILIILLILAMLATVFALVRGLISYANPSPEDLEGDGINRSGERQNRMMRMRILFQGIAVIIAVLVMLLASGR